MSNPLATLSPSLRAALAGLPLPLLAHCRRVASLAAYLARRHAVALGQIPDDIAPKARLAGLVHDLARAWSGQELLALAGELGLPVGETEARLPVLLHGPVGAALLRRDFGIQDEELLAAVDCHTTGRREMGALDKLLYVADKTEPGKLAGDPALAPLRRQAEVDLDKALLGLLEHHLAQLKGRGGLVHPASLEAAAALRTAPRQPS